MASIVAHPPDDCTVSFSGMILTWVRVFNELEVTGMHASGS